MSKSLGRNAELHNTMKGTHMKAKELQLLAEHEQVERSRFVLSGVSYTLSLLADSLDNDRAFPSRIRRKLLRLRAKIGMTSVEMAQIVNELLEADA